MRVAPHEDIAEGVGHREAREREDQNIVTPCEQTLAGEPFDQETVPLDQIHAIALAKPVEVNPLRGRQESF